MLIELRTPSDIDMFRIEHACPLWAHNKPLIVEIIGNETGKWGMARLWRKWMSDTADWMAWQGATMPLAVKPDGTLWGSRPFNANDAHELFCAQWLGVGADGKRLSWAKQAHDGMRPATKAERFFAMLRHEEWCSERGIQLFNPRIDNEYYDMTKANNGR